MNCEDYDLFYAVPTQIECQSKCEEISGCKGISYTHKLDTIFKHFCYVCMNDVLKSANYGFGFYRKLGKTKL